MAIPFGVTDFGRIADASIFQFTLPFHFGLPTFSVGATISMFVVMLVIMTETTADILAIGQVIDKPADRQTVTNGLRADMLATTFASVFNGFSVSAFAQNVGLVAITGIKSRFVVAVGGVILVLLGLFPILGALIAVVPLPVLGGAGSPSSARCRQRHPYPVQGRLLGQRQPGHRRVRHRHGHHPDRRADVLRRVPGLVQMIFDSGITAAAITAVLLNIVFNIIGRPHDTEGPIFSEGPAPAAISDADEARLTDQPRSPETPR